MDALIIFCATYLIYAIALGALVYGVLSPKAERLEFFAALLMALPLAYALARVLGFLYTHPQPFAIEGYEPLVPHEVDNAFPSDHAALSAVFAGLTAFYRRGAGLVLWLMALGVGVGRVLIGFHYPLDIAAGFLAGAAAAAAAYYGVHSYFSTRRRY